MEKRGYLQISFAWLFAIIVGVFILFLAIFLSTKIISRGQEISEAKTGKEIGILLNPLETGFETGKTNSFSIPVETRIYNNCSDFGNFGRQLIGISQKSFNKWVETEVNAGFSNKYIFSKSVVEGKNFYLFSKPFNLPFKVSDVIYMTSSLEDYCFINAPSDIKRELQRLNQKNLLVDNCSSNSISVCFQKRNCDINVFYDSGYVEKNKEKLYFEDDALMYAAVFSDKKLYECQTKRLMKRIESLALLYQNKETFISKTGCSSNLNVDLEVLKKSAGDFRDSSNIRQISVIAKDIGDKNQYNVDCKLW
jgi:hypothetical protein